MEGINSSLLIAEWNGDLFLIQVTDVVTEWLAATLLDFVELS